ncbi:hypothetical protein M409DRAFT_54053 [Zasmidium cellare ATCC 36951]|uniref:Uncharacterized protein n=1 Tax=Zasmidium cellare ATCC 36951 TaxID=1080233 RepID=A0A6A6CJX2_ZASCE|nr:uncharacterized protein M409DRAFT_54053 [Zasmidium cellare ATCC 36951]KAF2167455.1 hypothetical protein M409DRAFT_54053 [Zasmidium cellare ATCC 36951]
MGQARTNLDLACSVAALGDHTSFAPASAKQHAHRFCSADSTTRAASDLSLVASSHALLTPTPPTAKMPPGKRVAPRTMTHTELTPPRRRNRVASASRPYKCNVDGIGYEMMAFIQVTQPKSSESCRNFWGGVSITNTERTDYVLAEIEAIEVDRRHLRCAKSTVPPWAKELLRKPEKYEGHLKEHSGDGDELSDLQKVLQILYGPRGRPKPHLREKDRRQLRTNMLHYISSFCVEPEWRGKRLAEHALLAYMNVLGQFFNYGGPVILSPAPLRDETDWMRQNKKPVDSYEKNIQKIEKTYLRADFDSIFEPTAGNGNITVMMRSNTAISLQPKKLEKQKPANPFLKQVKAGPSQKPPKAKRKVIGGARPPKRA